MSGNRRRLLVSYLVLAAIFVGTVANALLPLAAPPAPGWAASASLLIDADDVDEGGLLPGALLSREGQVERSPRVGSGDEPDSGAVPPAIAASIRIAAPAGAGFVDTSSPHPASARTSDRPRDPPHRA